MAKKILNETTNSDKKRAINRLQVASVTPWRVVENWDHLIINDDFLRMGVINSWPNRLPVNWGEQFMTFKDKIPVSFVLIRRPDSDVRSFLALTMNTNAWEATQINESVIDRRQREFESMQASEATDMIIQSNAKLYETYVYLQMRADKMAELDATTQSSRQHVNGSGLDLSWEKMNQLAMFWAASPFLLEDKIINERYNFTMPVTTISRGLINRDNGLCDPVGVPLGKNDKHGEPIIIDFSSRPDDRPNSNISVVAESGQGKSALLKLIALYLCVLYGYRAIIIDIDGEYGWITKKLNGFSAEIDGSGTTVLSPFPPRNTLATNIDNLEEYGVSDDEISVAFEAAKRVRVLASHLPFLLTFLMKNFGLKEEHKNVLNIACTWAYNQYGITNEMTFGEYNAGDYSYPVLVDIYRQLPNVPRYYPGTEKLVQEIQQAFFKGIYGAERHLWGRSSLEIPNDASIVRINLQGLSQDENQQSAQYYNTLTWVWSQLRSNRYSEKMTFIFADEIHVLANNPDALSMLKDIAQRIRKYNGGLVTSTQRLTELMHSTIRHLGEGIITSSSYQFYSKAEGSWDGSESTNAYWVKSLLKATDKTMNDLSSAGKGKFILKAGSQEEWINIQLPDWFSDYEGVAGGR